MQNIIIVIIEFASNDINDRKLDALSKFVSKCSYKVLKTTDIRCR